MHQLLFQGGLVLPVPNGIRPDVPHMGAIRQLETFALADPLQSNH